MSESAAVSVDAGATGGDAGGAELDTTAAQWDDNDPSTYWDLDDGKGEDGSKKTRRISVTEARKLAQKGFGADKTFSEAAKAREEAQATKKQMAELARMFKEDPEKVMRAFELDPDEWYRSRYERQVAEAQLDPRDRENRDLKARMARYEEAERAQREEQERAHITERATAMQGQLLGKIEQVLKTSGVPQTPSTVAEIGRYLQQAHSAGKDIFNMPLDHIVKHIQTRRQSEFNEVYGAYDDDGLLENVDPKLLNRILQAHTKRMQAQAPGIRRPAQQRQEQAPVSNGPKSAAQIRKEHAERIEKAQAEFDRMNHRGGS